MNTKKHILAGIVLIVATAGAAEAAPLATITTQAVSGESWFTAEGVVEAVKSSIIAAQVTGSVTTLTVKAGDSIRRGQLLTRIDPRLAEQQALTNQAQVAAARAQLATARNELERKQRLLEKQYISRAAMDRAESDFKSAEAEANASQAQSGMSRVQTGLHALNAPYDGIVAEVMTEIGSMVMPDKPLLSIYDPRKMRVLASVPQSQLASIKPGAAVQIEMADGVTLTSHAMTILPLADAVSHVVQIRVALPTDNPGLTPNINKPGLTPGMFARVRFAIDNGEAGGRIRIPLTALVRRSELIAVYVLAKNGQAQLRQVRLGQQTGSDVEIASGLQAGERVILDPLAAARQ